MNKNMIVLLILLLWASPVAAQEAAGAKSAAAPAAGAATPESPEVLDVGIGLLYRSMSLDRSTRAAEYEHIKNSGGGALDLEWDPLPHRFKVETSVLNEKDYFGEMDYAFKDLVLFNLNARGLHHNLDHYNIGQDDPATVSPSFTDNNPDDLYAVDSRWQKASIRLKTPDFPFHLYAEAQIAEREGTVQQRFMRGYTGGLDKVSQSRKIDGTAQEIRVGANSHLGYFEVDYSHAERKSRSHEDKGLVDVYTAPAMDIPHNVTPDLKSSSDTVKLHTTYSGRFVAAATYSGGDRKNQDSGAKVDFRNAAGDVTITPVAHLVFFLKYRHYDLSANNPETVTMPGLGAAYNVRDALSSKRDQLNGMIRYRPTARLTLKAEYVFDTIARNAREGATLTPLQISPTSSGTGPDSWEVGHRATKGTGKVGLSYRLNSTLMLRADYSALRVTNPAYTADPDRAASARASLTWSPIKRVTTLLSYGGVREKRDELAAPLAGGSRKVERDQALGSLTVLVGKRSSITASYLYFKNKTAQTVTYRDAAGLYLLEHGVPYADKTEVASLTLTQALGDGLLFVAEGSKSFSKGRFRSDGSVANTAGIDEFSDLRIVENIYAAGIEAQLSKTVKSELRYQERHYDDRIDNSQDGKLNTMLATVSVKW